MIVSEKFMVNSEAERMAATRYAAESFTGQIGLDKRDALRLNLLVEETLGMVKATLEEFYGQLWFVANGKTCELHFEATADMDPDKKRELLSVSSTGKNAAAKGFMAKLGEMISNALHGVGDTIDVYGSETIKYGIVHTPETMLPSADMMTIWTLQDYRTNLEDAADGAAEAALEDLEKSIVARIADDVVVGVRGDRVDLIITKAF